jgi:hypothetical protein
MKRKHKPKRSANRNDKFSDGSGRKPRRNEGKRDKRVDWED